MSWSQPRASPRRAKPARPWTWRRCGGRSCSIPTAVRSTRASSPPHATPSTPPARGPFESRDRAEAWFYLAAAYAPLVQWRVLRGDRLAAARDGNRIRSALERALDLDPTLHDAKFGIGLYHYYADVASAGAKILRWLLLLPGGDRVAGTARNARSSRPGRAAARAKPTSSCTGSISGTSSSPTVRCRCSSNWIGAIRPTRSSSSASPKCRTNTFTTIPPARRRGPHCSIDRRRADRNAAGLAEVNARLGLGVELDAMFETDRALVQFQSVVQMTPAAPHDGLARAHLLLGAALRSTRQSSDGGRGVQRRHHARAGSRCERHPRPRPGGARSSPGRQQSPQAYRLSIEGLRALEQRRRRPRGLAAGARRLVDTRRSGRDLSLLERAAGDRRCDARAINA